jgi:hypothetical protein
MPSIICTLFEDHYHYGVASLTNSLYWQGFRGSLFAGYRGELPPWASPAIANNNLEWPGARTYNVEDRIKLHFLPLETDYHLTNYKPDFMIKILQEIEHEVDAIFYFDPDIVANIGWPSFEKWAACGVALCEDVNSPMHEHHPRRVAWRNFFGENGICLNFKDSIYVNGGFIGLARQEFEFLNLWKTLQEKMALVIGGLNRSSLNGNTLPEEARDQFGPFPKTDQDALNATVEAWNGRISFIGMEGMGFKSGASLMGHALGNPKPWNSNPLLMAFDGCAPRMVDKGYWISSKGPVNAHSTGMIKYKLISLRIASALARFYRRV